MAFFKNCYQEDKKNLENSINNIKTDIDNLGNTNILLNADFNSPISSSERKTWDDTEINTETLDNWFKNNAKISVSITNKKLKLIVTQASQTGYLIQPIKEKESLIGKTVTIGANILNYTGSNFYLVVSSSNDNFTNSEMIQSSICKIDKKGIVSTTFTIPSSLTYNNLNFSIVADRAQANDFVEFEWIKFELGNKLTKPTFVHKRLIELLLNTDNKKHTKVMTVKIDETNSNPETALTYADDALEMTPRSQAWDDWFGLRPCLFKDGKNIGYLNPNDFTIYEDGRPADIVSGNSGDVMIEIPLKGISFSRNGNILTIKMTDEINKSGFQYYAHARGKNIKDKIYIGAYKGFIKDSKLRSLSGKEPTVNTTLPNFRNAAHNTGQGYEITPYFVRLLIQCMYVLKYKNLDSQTVIGQGNVSNNGKLNTGATDKKGMTWGSTSNKEQIKLFGIEDFFGNIWEWIDGIKTDASFNILVSTTNDNFNDTGDGYYKIITGDNTTIFGWNKMTIGTNEGGFLIKSTGASASTYYCDGGYRAASRCGCAGGAWDCGSDVGVFHLALDSSAASSYSDFGARLVFI